MRAGTHRSAALTRPCCSTRCRPSSAALCRGRCWCDPGRAWLQGAHAGGAPLAAIACLPGACRRAHARCASSEPARQPGRLRGRPGGPCAAEPSGSRTAPHPEQRSCCGPLPAQAALGALHEHAQRGRGLLPLALSAVEAALRRVPDAADDSEPNAARVAARQARPARASVPASSDGCAGSRAAASPSRE